MAWPPNTGAFKWCPPPGPFGTYVDEHQYIKLSGGQFRSGSTIRPSCSRPERPIFLGLILIQPSSNLITASWTQFQWGYGQGVWFKCGEIKILVKLLELARAPRSYVWSNLKFSQIQVSPSDLQCRCVNFPPPPPAVAKRRERGCGQCPASLSHWMVFWSVFPPYWSRFHWSLSCLWDLEGTLGGAEHSPKLSLDKKHTDWQKQL